MSAINRLFVTLTTADVKDANSDSRMRLVFDNGSSGKREFELGGQPHDERERGRTDLYPINFTPSNIELEDTLPEHFKIVAAGDDAWLPSSIFIIGGDIGGQFKVLVANENWPADAWFSTQGTDANGRAEKARLLDRSGTPTIA